MWQVYARNCDERRDRSRHRRRPSAARRPRRQRRSRRRQRRGARRDVLAQLQRATSATRARVDHRVRQPPDPKRDYAATDLIVQAASGTMAITGFGDSKPLRTGAITAWSHAGVAAAGAALLALRSADRTGRGQHVDISAQQACNLAASYSLLTAYVGASRFGRTGVRRTSADLAVAKTVSSR